MQLIILWQCRKKSEFLTTKSTWLNEIIDEHTQPQRALTKVE